MSGSLLGDLTFDYLIGVYNGVIASIAQCEDKEAEMCPFSHSLLHPYGHTSQEISHGLRPNEF